MKVDIQQKQDIPQAVHNKWAQFARQSFTYKWKKAKRPLKMPKDYDFSVRGVNWKEYKQDYLLRTDAIWEKIQMKDVFYSFYKTMMYDQKFDRYVVGNLREHDYPSNDGSDLSEEWVPFQGYSSTDGCIWQFNSGPCVAAPDSYSDFTAEKERDNWSHCTATLNRWFICNDRSPVKLDEINLFTSGFQDYPCYNELEKVLDTCGGDMFQKVYELFKYRFHHYEKPSSMGRLQLYPDLYGTVRDRRDLYY